MGRARNVVEVLIQATDQTQGAFSSVASQIIKLAGPATLGLAIVKSAEFEENLLAIQTVLRADAQGLSQVSDELKKMSVQFGQSISSMSKARYDVISSGFNSIAESARIVEQSGKLAVAGIADIAPTAKLLTAVLNAYGYEADRAGEVSDILFTTVERGVTTIPELAQSFGMVLGNARLAKVPLEDLAAAFAAITLKGIDTAETATALNNLLVQLASPGSKEAERTLHNLGLSLEDGLIPMLQQLAIVGEGGLRELEKLVPNIRALKAAAAAGADIETLNSILRDTQHAAGATDRALATMSEGLAFKFRQLKQAVTVLLLQLGDPLVTSAKRAVDQLREVAGFMSRHQDATAFATSLLTVATSLMAIGTAAGIAKRALAPLLGMHAAIAGSLAAGGYYGATGAAWGMAGAGAGMMMGAGGLAAAGLLYGIGRRSPNARGTPSQEWSRRAQRERLDTALNQWLQGGGELGSVGRPEMGPQQAPPGPSQDLQAVMNRYAELLEDVGVKFREGIGEQPDQLALLKQAFEDLGATGEEYQMVLDAIAEREQETRDKRTDEEREAAQEYERAWSDANDALEEGEAQLDEARRERRKRRSEETREDVNEVKQWLQELATFTVSDLFNVLYTGFSSLGRVITSALSGEKVKPLKMMLSAILDIVIAIAARMLAAAAAAAILGKAAGAAASGGGGGFSLFKLSLFNAGGTVRNAAQGMIVSGTRGYDHVPAMLGGGEQVLTADQRAQMLTMLGGQVGAPRGGPSLPSDIRPRITIDAPIKANRPLSRWEQADLAQSVHEGLAGAARYVVA